MLAARLATILPPLTPAELLEVSRTKARWAELERHQGTLKNSCFSRPVQI